MITGLPTKRIEALWQFYLQDGGRIKWHRYGTKLRHCHPLYKDITNNGSTQNVICGCSGKKCNCWRPFTLRFYARASARDSPRGYPCVVWTASLLSMSSGHNWHACIRTSPRVRTWCERLFRHYIFLHFYVQVITTWLSVFYVFN